MKRNNRLFLGTHKGTIKENVMNQIRDWKGECHRCFDATEFHIMSMFDCALICMKCHTSERAHPDYEKAQKAEAEAVKNGDRNFEGIGWPEREIANDPMEW